MDRAAAAIALVDSNLHRDNVLPSERAFAYKLKMEALSHQGKRTDLTSAQVEPKLSTEIIAESENVSRETVKRYIRLTKLLPELLKYVDEGRIAFTPAVELSYLNDIEQRDLIEVIESEDCTPSLSQANQKERIKIPTEHVRKYFPRSYSNAQIEEAIIKLCEVHYRKKQRQQER